MHFNSSYVILFKVVLRHIKLIINKGVIMRKENGKISKSKVIENAFIALIPLVKLVGIIFVAYSVTAA